MGAVAILCENLPAELSEEVTYIQVADTARAMGRMASNFYDNPSSKLKLVGVTGTNGKTSSVTLLFKLFRQLGYHTGLLSTVQNQIDEEVIPSTHTTPDSVKINELLAEMLRRGCTHCFMEVSSHAIHQQRIAGLRFAGAAFTNITHDHLDYHKDMDDYFAAKMRLFDEVVADDGTAVVWMDDAWSARAVDHVQRRGIRLLGVGQGADVDGIRLLSRTPGQLGQELEIEFAGQVRKLNLPLIGAYQAANALVSAGLVLATGGEAAQVFDALTRLQPVRGRLERAAISRSGAPVYVDYAHTPDALEAAIAALRPHCAGRLIVVFGAGGDRDAGKRGPMGTVVAQQADLGIVTDDNPRGEDPASIRSQVMAGGAGLREVADRRSAIAAAIAEAGSQDIVLVAGKGHEQGQIIGAGETCRVLPFDDVAVARECAA